MLSTAQRSLPRLRSLNLHPRTAATVARTPLPKPVGDISSIFPSLSGQKSVPLPGRFARVKHDLIAGNEAALQASWDRLLPALSAELDEICARGSDAIPSIPFSSLSSPLAEETLTTIRRRGAVIIRNVLPSSLALDLKASARAYISANAARVRAFPRKTPAVYEVYWSPAQVHARAHANTLAAQSFLQTIWHSSSANSRIASSIPLSYADRLRIRLPGDTSFALGPHIDGGSLERWEDPNYAAVYSRIFSGDWESYDPYDAAHRLDANMDLYNGAGACAMFRMWQGWLSLSSTPPGAGTLRLLPALRHSTAYFLLRPFFSAETGQLILPPTPEIHGAVQAAAQELRERWHPHLRLEESMVSIPNVEPGDFVAWHCDAIHQVDSVHNGEKDSSVMYIPATPLCRLNAAYLKRQRDAALKGNVPPDFPCAGIDGLGEGGFNGEVQWETVNKDGRQAMGIGNEGWSEKEGMNEGSKKAVRDANWELFGI